MDKDQQTKEIDRILKEAVALREKSQLDLDTAEFLNDEAMKLEAIVDDSESRPEEKESAMVKLEALNKRILIELNESTDRLDKMEEDFNALIKELQ